MSGAAVCDRSLCVGLLAAAETGIVSVELKGGPRFVVRGGDGRWQILLQYCPFCGTRVGDRSFFAGLESYPAAMSRG